MDSNHKNCVVYMAVNVTNGKSYIGATKMGLARRKNTHIYNAKRGHRGKFYSALRKYGAEKFIFSVLVICENYLEALSCERAQIAERRPEYNITLGGGGSLGVFPSAETRERQRLAKIGKKITDPTRLKNMRDNILKQVEKRKRKVRCMDDGLEFESANAAARFYKISDSSIVGHCKGRFAKGRLNFEYLEPSERVRKKIAAVVPSSLLVAARRRNVQYATRAASKAVVCVNDGEQYPSQSAAARKYGIHTSRVGRVCRGEARSVYGLCFQFAGAQK